jgi:hypothetical protein
MTHIQSIIDAIEDGMRRYARLGEVDEEVFRRSYAPGKWTARQILAHVADSEMVCYIRILQGIAEEGNELAEFKMDSERWVQELRYDERPAALSLAAIVGTRKVLLHILRTTPEERLRRELTHPKLGKVTPLFYAKIPAEHGMHHLEQLEAIRDGREWKKEAESAD